MHDSFAFRIFDQSGNDYLFCFTIIALKFTFGPSVDDVINMHNYSQKKGFLLDNKSSNFWTNFKKNRQKKVPK